MEEYIKYFYNIKVDNYTINNEIYYIKSDKKNYEFLRFEENPLVLYEKYILLKKSGVCCHDIIFNRNNEIVSNYNSKPYLLLRVNVNSNRNITIFDLYNSIAIINNNKEVDIKKLWEIKNDYYESILEKIYSNNLELALNFDYFLGLSELSINLLSYTNFNNIIFYAQHKRLKNKQSIKNFLNPINIIIDSRVRDLSFYIKNMFFEENIDINDIKQILKNFRLTNDESIIFLSRMIYPDYYFDICDSITNENLNNNKLKKCIKKNTQYENFLKEIYQYLHKIYNVPNIEWLT